MSLQDTKYKSFYVIHRDCDVGVPGDEFGPCSVLVDDAGKLIVVEGKHHTAYNTDYWLKIKGEAL